MVKMAEKSETAMRKNPESTVSIFTVFYWRRKFEEIRVNLPPKKAIINFMIEVDSKYDSSKWVNHAKNVTTGNAGLAITQEVCEVLEKYLQDSGEEKAKKQVSKTLSKHKIITS